MAFPTSGLSNNQVHKEGNRAFVYDSTLDVWDQIRETDRTEREPANLSLSTGTLTNATFPTGHVLQCLSATKTDVFSSAQTADTWTAVPGLLIVITPSATSSKILVQYHVNVAQSAGAHSGVATGIYRDGTLISGAKAISAAGSQEKVTTVTTHYNQDDSNAGTDVHSMSFLDSPSTTSAITYQVYLFNASGSGFYSYVNRTQSDGVAAYVTRGASTISVIEVAG